MFISLNQHSIGILDTGDNILKSPSYIILGPIR